MTDIGTFTDGHDVSKKFPVAPKSPHRICWGCDKYCPTDSLSCGNGSERTLHPIELFGEDWLEWGLDSAASSEHPQPPSATKD